MKLGSLLAIALLTPACGGPGLEERIELAFGRARAFEVEDPPGIKRKRLERVLCFQSHLELQLDLCTECLVEFYPPCGWVTVDPNLPDLEGSITQVRDPFVLIELDEIPTTFDGTGAVLRFDIYAGQTYKGRAISLEAFDRYHLGKITSRVSGTNIGTGDRADTRL